MPEVKEMAEILSMWVSSYVKCMFRKHEESVEPVTEHVLNTYKALDSRATITYRK